MFITGVYFYVFVIYILSVLKLYILSVYMAICKMYLYIYRMDMCGIHLYRCMCQVYMWTCRLCSCINHHVVYAKSTFIISKRVFVYAKCVGVYVASISIYAGCEGVFILRIMCIWIYMCNSLMLRFIYLLLDSFMCSCVKLGYIGCVCLCVCVCECVMYVRCIVIGADV